VKAPASSTTSIYRAEMIAISVALQKVVELQERYLVPKEAHISLYTDSRSVIQKLAKATGKEEIVHHVLSLVEQIAAGGNAQMMFQWIPGHCGIEGNMWADNIAKDTSTLPQSAAPVDFSTAKTVIRHLCTRKWSKMAKPAVPHATYVNRDQEKDFTPSQRTLLSRLRTGEHTPELAWCRNRITRNQDQSELATCQRCGQAEETLVHLMTECPILEDARNHHDPITFLFNEPEVALSYLRDAGLIEASRI